MAGADRKPDPQLPFLEPGRHFKFTDEGITNEVVSGRRSSSYLIPIAPPKKEGKQLSFDIEWTQDRIEENNCQRHPPEILSVPIANWLPSTPVQPWFPVESDPPEPK